MKCCALSNRRVFRNCICAGLLICQIGCLKFDLFSNKSDPRLAELNSSGDNVVYFGGRDDDGLPEGLLGTRVTASFEDPVDIQVDELGRPVKFVSADGVTTTIEWLSETKFVVTFFSADRSIQIQIPFDTVTETAGQAAVSYQIQGEPPAVEKNLAPRGNKKLIARFEPDEPVEVDERAAAQAVANGFVIVTVVNSCDGSPINDANVEVAYRPNVDPFDDGSIVGSATPLGNGQYSFPVPIAGQTVGDDVEKLCEKLAFPLKLGCDGLRFIPPTADAAICISLAAALDAINIPSGEAVPLSAACISGFESARLACQAMGDPSNFPSPPSLADFICNNVGDVVDSAGIEGASIIARATRGKFSNVSDPVSMPGTGPAPSIQLQLNGEGQLESLTTSPVDPAPHQGYTATAKVRCAPEGTMVNLSVQGSDGYSDQVTVAVTGTGTVSLVVPGAEANVRDDLRASIVGGTGLIIIKSILF